MVMIILKNLEVMGVVCITLNIVVIEVGETVMEDIIIIILAEKTIEMNYIYT